MVITIHEVPVFGFYLTVILKQLRRGPARMRKLMIRKLNHQILIQLTVSYFSQNKLYRIQNAVVHVELKNRNHKHKNLHQSAKISNNFSSQCDPRFLKGYIYIQFGLKLVRLEFRLATIAGPHLKNYTSSDLNRFLYTLLCFSWDPNCSSTWLFAKTPQTCSAFHDLLALYS